MLPPQLQSSLPVARRHSFSAATCLLREASVAHTIRATSAYTQARHFWGWKRARSEYSSHLDPLYQRFTRYRTMKTRAKLLEKLKRRGRFEWDINQRPFFTPKHIRYASHFNGRGPRWPPLDQEGEDPSRKQNGKETEDGYELSQREKEWKERMEYMRKRIETDPYEAVFGKRFEPFWGPLVPSWMREEMGSQGWPKAQKDMAKAIKAEPVEPESNQVDVGSKAEVRTSKPQKLDETTKPKRAETTTKNATQPYSSYSSTSWDSWTNKTKRTEWDSTSGQVKRFEYDPVSNRMVQIGEPKPAENGKPEPAKIVTVKNPATQQSALELKRTNYMRSLINTPPKDDKALQIPVKMSFAVTPKSTAIFDEKKPTDDDVAAKLKQLRAAGFSWSEGADKGLNVLKDELAPRSGRTQIPVGFAPPVADHSKQPSPTGIQNVKAKVDSLRDAGRQDNLPKSITKPSTSPRPAALSKLPANDLDLLTADDVRAKMGKVKLSNSPKPATAEEKAALETSFDSSAAEWDKAEEAVMRERDLESSQKKRERELRRLQKQQANMVKGQQEFLRGKLAKLEREIGELEGKLSKDREGGVTPVPRMQTSLDRTSTTKAVTDSSTVLQPAVERMQTKELPSTTTDLDDAAAHESTEAIETSSTVPKEWSQAADLLQADRVKRTASKKSYPMTRWIVDMQARKAAHEAAATNTASAAEQAAARAKAEKLEKVNAMLESDVREQKFRMQAHETRYAHKIRSLRGELEAAHRQSAVHSGKHVERIRVLEGELGRVSKVVGGGEAGTVGKSDVQKAEPIIQGEGDFSPDIAKFVDRGRWYKQPAIQQPVLSKQEVETAQQKAGDQALVKEVREVYEREYGVIDAGHRQRGSTGHEVKVSADRGPKNQMQKQFVEVESDVDLGEALAEHEKSASYGFAGDGLEKGMQAREKEAHEAQALMRPESAEKMKRIIAEGLQHTSRTRSATGVKRQPAKAEAATKKIESTIQWEEPPVYKILAYDPGNDMFSMATTTANFTGTETPISIPQALQQLYQPARFVPHFAELQQDGWQVIHGTADLLVFKKVKAAPAPARKETNSATPTPVASETEHDDLGLVDHGVVTPKENALAQEAANYYDKYKPEPKPYDPTSIENGNLMPYENAMAQEAADAYDAARWNPVNPIDGTTKAIPAAEISTGHFASPTGFVNHDRTFLDEVSSAKVKEAMNKKESAPVEGDVDFVHYPRVRRQEQVFSGTRRAETKRRWNEQHQRHQCRDEAKRDGRRRHRRGGALKWALSVGVGASGVTYLVGMAAEMARQDRREKERWEEVLEGKRGRWE